MQTSHALICTVIMCIAVNATDTLCVHIFALTPCSSLRNELFYAHYCISGGQFLFMQTHVQHKGSVMSKIGRKLCMCVFSVCVREFGHNLPYSYCTYVVPCNGFRRLFLLGIALLHSVFVYFPMFANEPFWWIGVERVQCRVGQHIGLETDLFCRARHFVLGLNCILYLFVCVGGWVHISKLVSGC